MKTVGAKVQYFEKSIEKDSKIVKQNRLFGTTSTFFWFLSFFDFVEAFLFDCLNRISFCH